MCNLIQMCIRDSLYIDKPFQTFTDTGFPQELICLLYTSMVTSQPDNGYGIYIDWMLEEAQSE